VVGQIQRQLEFSMHRVGIELPILVLIPGLGNVAWHGASGLR
jgi:hypothetical protein